LEFSTTIGKTTPCRQTLWVSGAWTISSVIANCAVSAGCSMSRGNDPVCAPVGAAGLSRRPSKRAFRTAIDGGRRAAVSQWLMEKMDVTDKDLNTP
jgi:hypothetical protein